MQHVYPHPPHSPRCRGCAATLSAHSAVALHVQCSRIIRMGIRVGEPLQNSKRSPTCINQLTDNTRRRGGGRFQRSSTDRRQMRRRNTTIMIMMCGTDGGHHHVCGGSPVAWRRGLLAGDMSVGMCVAMEGDGVIVGAALQTVRAPQRRTCVMWRCNTSGDRLFGQSYHHDMTTSTLVTASPHGAAPTIAYCWRVAARV